MPETHPEEHIQKVIADIRAQLQLARDLNRRAGAKVFPELSDPEVRAHIAKQLGGARCVAEISNLAALRLPPLDPELVKKLEGNAPLTIEMLGTRVNVNYPEEGSDLTPRIELPESIALPDNAFMKLPDAGVLLPDGRQVKVRLLLGLGAPVATTDIKQLKQNTIALLRTREWEIWRQRPELPLPDLFSDGADLPNVGQHVYGKCPVDGSPLTAYSTVKLNPAAYSWGPASEQFIMGWLPSLEKAEADRSAAQARLEQVRTRIRLEREQRIIQVQANLAAGTFLPRGVRELRDEIRVLEDRSYQKLFNIEQEAINTWVKVRLGDFSDPAEQARLAEALQVTEIDLPELTGVADAVSQLEERRQHSGKSIKLHGKNFDVVRSGSYISVDLGREGMDILHLLRWEDLPAAWKQPVRYGLREISQEIHFRVVSGSNKVHNAQIKADGFNEFRRQVVLEEEQVRERLGSTNSLPEEPHKLWSKFVVKQGPQAGDEETCYLVAGDTQTYRGDDARQTSLAKAVELVTNWLRGIIVRKYEEATAGITPDEQTVNKFLAEVTEILEPHNEDYTDSDYLKAEYLKSAVMAIDESFAQAGDLRGKEKAKLLAEVARLEKRFAGSTGSKKVMEEASRQKTKIDRALARDDVKYAQSLLPEYEAAVMATTPKPEGPAVAEDTRNQHAQRSLEANRQRKQRIADRQR